MQPVNIHRSDIPSRCLNTGIQGPFNIVISLNQKKLRNYYEYLTNY